MRRICDYFLTEVLSQAFGVRTWRDGIGFDLSQGIEAGGRFSILYVNSKVTRIHCLGSARRIRFFFRSTTFDTNTIFQLYSGLVLTVP